LGYWYGLQGDKLKTIVLKEAGHDEAALGFSLSYNSTVERAKQLFPSFAFKQGGENKFLESIMIWLDVTAPRFWWQEADTYRVGTSKQSESTMHTISKKPLTDADFEYPLEGEVLWELNNSIRWYNDPVIQGEEKKMYLAYIKNQLPEGFLQRRIWTMNYKGLQNMYNQRKNHRLPQWYYFFGELFTQLEHKEFILKEIK